MQQRLRLPAGHTVFAVRPLREPAAPAVPLLLLHGLADPAQEASLDVSVLVRPVAALRLPRPLDAADAEPIPLEALAGGDGAAAMARRGAAWRCGRGVALATWWRRRDDATTMARRGVA